MRDVSHSDNQNGDSFHRIRSLPSRTIHLEIKGTFRSSRLCVPGDQNEHPRLASEAVRADVQEQHVHTAAVQADRHHLRVNVLPTVFWGERVQLLRGHYIPSDARRHESSRRDHCNWLRAIIGFSVIRYGNPRLSLRVVATRALDECPRPKETLDGTKHEQRNIETNLN